MDNRRLFLAIILSMAILIVWGYLFPVPEPTPGPAPPTSPPVSTDSSADASVGSPTDERQASGEPVVGRPAADPSMPGSVEAEPPSSELADPQEATLEARVVLETASVRVELSNRGAQLISYLLLEHTDSEGNPLNVVRRRSGGPYPFAVLDADGRPLPIQDALFEVEHEPDGLSATFRYRGELGAAEKRFELRDGFLDFGVRVEGRDDWSLLIGPGVRNPTAEELESRFSRTGGVYLLGDEVELPDARRADEPIIVPGGGLSWAGLEDSYFLSAVLPRSPVRQAVYVPMVFLFDESTQIGEFEPYVDQGKDARRDFALWIEPEGDRVEARSYWGAKDFDRLAALPGGLEKTVDLGWFSFLARPMMIGLQWIHENLVANYGWAIVLMTLLIRIILLYPTHKSTVSMRKMQELNPRIQAIRQKYSSKLKDKQGRPNLEAQNKMNQEIMALYKSEGANPAGGCLPMILQIPVFFAFYKVLYSWVELRHAPWILWVEDLAAPDPYYALPLVMGATQFLQQKMMPAAGNPMQRRIMMLMPVFFTFLFLSFPAGLVLYWLTNNVLGIVQQGAYNWWKERSENDGDRKPVRAAKG